MKLLGIFVALIAAIVQADHVVFVHGLLGFGPDELFGLNYWGFTGIFGSSQDYFKPLRNKGFTVHYASVGPVSSNHDRACELYAQIKGTKVDYGKKHASRYGHAQFGKDYRNKGSFPSWDGRRKIHLVGHSMGGTTIRTLEHYLQRGVSEEVSASGSSVSLLFKPGTQKPGGGNWIQSITTISTPFDGSPLIDQLGNGLVNFIKDLVGVFAGIAELASSDPDWDFDFDLEHFGLKRGSSESFWTYYNRVFSSSIFNKGFKDFASYDLSVAGSVEFNKISSLTYAGTFYFSIATEHTKAKWSLLGGWDQVP